MIRDLIDLLKILNILTVKCIAFKIMSFIETIKEELFLDCSYRYLYKIYLQIFK